MFTSDEKPAIGRQINRFLLWLDRIPLWWTGILIVVVFFSPYFILGDGCIFEINDQLDESIMNYMLPALMGACFIMVSWGQPKMIPLGLGVAILVRVLFTYVFSGLSGFIDIVSIFGTIAVALLLTKKNVWLKNE